MTSGAASRGHGRAQDFWLANLSAADAYTRWVIDEVRPWLKGRTLEIGCGTGTFTVPMAALVEDLVAIDIDPGYVESAMRRTADLPNVTVRPGDATDPGCALGEAFDTLVMLDVLEHIENDVALLDDLRCRLKPGGSVVLKVPAIKALHSPMDQASGHWRRYDRAALATALSGAGFEPVRLWRFNACAVPGWWLNGRVLKRETPPAGQLALFNRLVPVFRAIDPILRHVTGLSYFAIGRRPLGGD